MVTPATIGWNIVSSSCRPRKYHGALEGFGVRLKLASFSSGALTKTENTSRNAVHSQGGHELDHQQVGPGVDLVDRRGLDVLDGAGLDHGEQALGVAAGAGGARHAPRPAPPCSRGAARRRAPPRGRRRRRRRGRGLGGRLRSAGGRDARAPRRSAASAAAASAGARPRPPPLAFGRGLGPGLLGPLAEVFGDLGHGAILAIGPECGHERPEMPPSLRTRQKWIAMKMTMTNGSISTWSTYQRSSVSAADLDAAEQHEAHLRCRTPACSPSCWCPP